MIPMSSRVFCLRLRAEARPRPKMLFEQVLLPCLTVTEVQDHLIAHHSIVGQMLFTRKMRGGGVEVYDMTPRVFQDHDVTGIFIPAIPLSLALGLDQ